MAGFWNAISRWTFMLSGTTAQGTGVRIRRGYAFPAEPTLLGEVLLRGIAEGA
jgi:hypothetical protein